MKIAALISGLLIALAVVFSVSASDLAGTAFKGMELYSWKPDGKDWHFSLLAGTNRLKSDEEIKKAEQTVVGVEQLKKELAKLAPGETVFLRNLAKEPAPKEMTKELKTFCDGINIKLFTIN